MNRGEEGINQWTDEQDKKIEPQFYCHLSCSPKKSNVDLTLCNELGFIGIQQMGCSKGQEVSMLLA